MLLHFIISVFWEYNDREFPAYVKKSVSSPIFALCYSPYCPHCIGLPDQLRRIDQKIGNREDIVFTMIDCINVVGCYRFGIRGTPHVSIIIGDKRRYWPIAHNNGFDEWDAFINKTLSPSLKEIHDDAELEVTKREPKDGGTTFFLETPSKNSDFIEELSKISRTYKIYNDTFVYRVNGKLNEPKLYAYYSEFCFREFTGNKDQIQKFVDDNKFGQFHRYDKDELKKIKTKTALFYTNTKLSYNQMESIRYLRKDHCDSEYAFGWANVQEEPQILKSTPAKVTDLPFMFISDNNYVYKGKISNFWSYVSGAKDNIEQIFNENMIKLILLLSSIAFVAYNIAIKGITFKNRFI